MERQGRRWVWWVLVVLVWALNGAAGLAAEEEAEKPQFMVIAEQDIIPEKMETYMQARIAGAKLCAQYDFEFPFLTFVQDFRVTTAYIFHAFAQIDGAPAMFEAWNEKTGGRSEQLDKQEMSCVDRVSTWINVVRPDLSYGPEEPAFVPDFSKPFYMSVTLYHVKPSKHDEAEAIAKKVRALEEKRESPMAYTMQESIFGPECTFFAGVACAKDKASFVELQNKMDANPDPEIEKLMAEGLKLLRKIETKEGTFVPEASYIPEGTFGD